MLLNIDNCFLFREIVSRIAKIGRNDLYLDWIQDAIFQLYQKGFRDIYKYVREIWIDESDNESVKRWETFLNLDVPPTYTLEDRITKVLYTLNARYCCTIDFLKQQALFFSNGEIEVIEDYKNYAFTIHFTGTGIPDNIENFKDMVRISKPAHLTYAIEYTYRTHRLLKVLTHGALKTWTHNAIRSIKQL